MKPKLAKQLQREFQANPKKGLVLLAISLWAIYAWLPLLWGESASNGKKSSTPGKTNPVASQAPTNPSTAATPAAQGPRHFDWRQLNRDMQADPQMLSASLEVHPHAFAALKVAEETNHPVAAVTSPDFTPEDLQVILQSTLQGPRGRVAVISGQKYRVGDDVVAGKTNEEVTFHVIDIQNRRVTLEREGKNYELKLEASKAGHVARSEGNHAAPNQPSPLPSP